MQIRVDVMRDASEIVHYDTLGIPLYIRMGRLSHYPGYRAICHWHEDLEFIRVYSGEMSYYINGASIRLAPGDCLFVNSRQMHFGYGTGEQECVFLCILVRAELLAGNELLYQKYFQPVIEANNKPFLHIPAESILAPVAQGSLDGAWEGKSGASAGYELRVIACLNRFWGSLLENSLLQDAVSTESDDLTVQRDMVNYIYKHFAEPLSLAAIASAGKVCRSRCCSLFKKYTRQSPVDFLNHYRLEVSRDLLASTELRIVDVALSCGFNTPSYFGKLFLRRYGCTPKAYRAASRDN